MGSSSSLPAPASKGWHWSQPAREGPASAGDGRVAGLPSFGPPWWWARKRLQQPLPTGSAAVSSCHGRRREAGEAGAGAGAAAAAAANLIARPAPVGVPAPVNRLPAGPRCPLEQDECVLQPASQPAGEACCGRATSRGKEGEKADRAPPLPSKCPQVGMGPEVQQHK